MEFRTLGAQFQCGNNKEKKGTEFDIDGNKNAKSETSVSFFSRKGPA